MKELWYVIDADGFVRGVSKSSLGACRKAYSYADNDEWPSYISGEVPPGWRCVPAFPVQAPGEKTKADLGAALKAKAGRKSR
jgi:hypothetical protein